MEPAMIGLTGLALVAGAVLGTAYFGGLWLTARRVPDSRHPAALALGSFVLRLLVAGAVFAWAARHGVLPAVAALTGFLAVRGAAIRLAVPTRRDAGS